eukprot:gene10485-8317_t
MRRRPGAAGVQVAAMPRLAGGERRRGEETRPTQGGALQGRRGNGLLGVKVGEAENPGPPKKTQKGGGKKGKQQGTGKAKKKGSCGGAKSPKSKKFDYAAVKEARKRDRDATLERMLITGGEEVTAGVTVWFEREQWEPFKPETWGGPLPPDWARKGGMLATDAPILKRLFPGSPILKAKLTQRRPPPSSDAQGSPEVSKGWAPVRDFGGRRIALRGLTVYIRGHSPKGAGLRARPLALVPPSAFVWITYRKEWGSPISYTLAEGSVKKVHAAIEETARTFEERGGGSRFTGGRWIANDEQQKRDEFVQKRDALLAERGGLKVRKDRKKKDQGTDAAEERPKAGRGARGGPPRKHLRIIQLNCTSLHSQHGDVVLLLEDHQPHVLLLQETNLRADAKRDRTPRFPGYEAL